MKVVASVSVWDVIEDKPETVWKVTNEWAGIKKKFFDDYYRKSERAVAYHIGNVVKFEEPRSLEDYGILHAPQSFTYI